MLEQAVEAAEREDWRAALIDVLAAWRERPALALSEAVEALTARAAEDCGSVLLAGQEGFRLAVWRAAAETDDPVARGELCTGIATISSLRTIRDQIARLERYGRDPRISAPVVEVIASLRHKDAQARGQRLELWDAIARNLSAPALARIRAITEPGWLGGDHTWFAGGPSGLVFAEQLAEQRMRFDVLAAELPVLADTEAAALARIVVATREQTAKRDQRRSRERELLARVYATPHDDGPRQIYADFLLEHGDPRGEFILLQLAQDRLGRRERSRIDQLYRTHAMRWRGPFPETVRSLVFVRGFVVEANPPGEIDNDPAWATIRSTTVAPRTDDTHLTSLEKLELDNAGITRLAGLRKPLPVRELVWRWIRRDRDGWARESAAAIAAFETITCLPALRSFALTGTHQRVHSGEGADITADDLRWLFRAPQLAEIAKLRLDLALPRVREVVAHVEAMRVGELAIVATSPGTRIRLDLRRDAANRLRELKLGVFDNLSASETRWLLDWFAHEHHHFTRIVVNRDAPVAIREAIATRVRPG